MTKSDPNWDPNWDWTIDKDYILYVHTRQWVWNNQYWIALF